MSIKKRMFELEWEKDKNEQQFINVRSDRKTVRINLDKIIYIESYSDYIKIHTSESETITKEKISRMAELLPDSFIRIHRSFIVNLDYIVSFNREEVTLANLELPFGRAFKTTAFKRLEA